MKPVPTLVLVALGGALLSVGCLGGAYTLANVDDSGSTEIITREIPWDGSATASLGLPAVMRYIQAPGPGKITARGPHRSVSTLKVDGGTIHDTLMRTGAVLEITLTAPSVTSFYLNGRSRLTIEGYDQPSLTLHIEGAAAIDASGHAANVRVLMEGDGDINLARLGAETIEGDLNGFGALIAAPARRAKFDVSGMASVILLTRPPDLETNLEDSGRVIDASPAH